jgi:multidrug efflux pump subunit AcrB
LGSTLVVIGSAVAASVGQAWIASLIADADRDTSRTLGMITTGGLIVTGSGIVLLQFGLQRWREDPLMPPESPDGAAAP